MTNVILNEVKNPRNKGRSGCIVVHTPGRVVSRGLNITDNIKSDGFAFPGDPSVNLRMTDCLITVMLSVSETSPGRVVFFGVYIKTKSRNARFFLAFRL